MSGERRLASSARELLSWVPYQLLRGNPAPAAAWLRKKLARTDCYLDVDVLIENPARFIGAPGSALYHGAHILNPRGFVTLGRDSHLGAFCHVNAVEGRVDIGEHVAVGPGTRLFAYSNSFEARRWVDEVHISADVRVGNNVFIGAGCTVLPGTVIDDNVVVGAGSVVKGTLAADAVYAGVPARLIQSSWYAGSDHDSSSEP